MDRVKKMSFGVMVVAMVGQLAYVRFGDDLEARFPAIKSARSALAGAGAGGGGRPYALGPDGAALDPRAYRKALMKDRKALASLGREKPAWRSVVERLDERVPRDAQHRLRDAARAKALLREPDGSATHPRLYRKLWLKDEDRMAAMRRDAPHMAATVLGDDVESFQEMLREMKRVEDGQEIYGAAGGRATIRAHDAAGAERLVDVVQPRLSEEEVQSSSLPEHMACAACLGVAHQLGATIRATAAKPTDGEPLSGCLLDAPPLARPGASTARPRGPPTAAGRAPDRPRPRQPCGPEAPKKKKKKKAAKARCWPASSPSPTSAPRGVTVAKHHKSAPGDRDPACAALTYRDPRDVAKRLDAFRDAGALLLRYEDFADCPAALAALFASWLGVEADLPLGFAETLAARSSLEANGALAARLRVFGKVDAASQIHGHHFSADGATGSWRTCLTDAALRHVEDRADRRWLARHRYAPATQPRR
ncbi:hypothetical protein JL720_10746 [Aureococcus anophagefferens]|nr:hypothetical protein JL720_10746 [Aureococcus anophagefferens]